MRILVIVSLTWVTAVAAVAIYEYASVTGGGSPKAFVVLRDQNSGVEFGSLSLKEILDLGKLTRQKSLSPEAEPTDADEAKSLLSAHPTPTFRKLSTISWIVFPILLLWLTRLAYIWILNGFQKQTQDHPVQVDNFIKTALIQLHEGISAANNHLTRGKPAETEPRPFLLPHGGTKETGTGVEFDLAVTIKSERNYRGLAKTKILSVVEAEVGAGTSRSNEQISRIRFMVFVNQWQG